MARRSFRYDPELGRLVELVDADEMERRHAVHGDIEPFVSVVDGTVIRSKSHLREYMAQHDLVTFDPTNRPSGPSIAEQQRRRQALREELWERVSATFSMGSKPRSHTGSLRNAPHYREDD